MFEDEWFHYFIPTYELKDCLIHGLNMIAEAPVFRTAEEFLTLYVIRKKKHKEFLKEDVMLRGISLRNLPDILYNPSKDAFYTP